MKKKRPGEGFRRVTMSISPGVLDKMDAIADEMSMSRSGFVEWLVVTLSKVMTVQGEALAKLMEAEVKKLGKRK